MTAARVYRWEELPADNPMPTISRRRIIGAQAMISHVRLARGCIVPSHAHENEQFAHVTEGLVRFTIGRAGQPHHAVHDVGAGGVLYLPANVAHAAEALEESIVLDIFSPPSEKTGVDEVRASEPPSA